MPHGAFDWISFLLLATIAAGVIVYFTNRNVPRLVAGALGGVLLLAFAFGLFLQWESRDERARALDECQAEYDAGERASDCEPFYR